MTVKNTAGVCYYMSVTILRIFSSSFSNLSSESLILPSTTLCRVTIESCRFSKPSFISRLSFSVSFMPPLVSFISNLCQFDHQIIVSHVYLKYLTSVRFDTLCNSRLNSSSKLIILLFVLTVRSSIRRSKPISNARMIKT